MLCNRKSHGSTRKRHRNMLCYFRSGSELSLDTVVNLEYVLDPTELVGFHKASACHVSMHSSPKSLSPMPTAEILSPCSLSTVSLFINTVYHRMTSSVASETHADNL
jgi:hypothetical protein